MPPPTPAVRAALPASLAVTVVVVIAACLHLAAVDRAPARLSAPLVEADASALDTAAAGARRGFPALESDARPVGDDEERARDERRAVVPTGRTSGGGVAATVAVAVGLWAALLGVVAALAWVAGPQTADRLVRLGEQVARADGPTPAARAWLGPLADAFGPAADRLRAQAAQAADDRAHIAALYQTNPHYVVLCSQDGEIVDANPAFYAVTGLSPGAVRGGAASVLRETFPVGPLMELAVRSLREASSISGVDYAVVDRDGQTRPVEVSLRGFRLAGRPMALIQATDHSHEKRLGRQVAAFSDTLDLMVDQRVHQLTAGQQDLGRTLDDAGVVVAAFDANGTTTRWNASAQALTGRPLAQVGHAAAAVSALGLSPADEAAFARWFWSPSSDPFVGLHDAGDGARALVWRRAHAGAPGGQDARTLVGIEVPVPSDPPTPSGDGQDGPEPLDVALADAGTEPSGAD